MTKLVIYWLCRGGVYPASSCLKISGYYGNLLRMFGARAGDKLVLFQRPGRMLPSGRVQWTVEHWLRTRRSSDCRIVDLWSWKTGTETSSFQLISYVTRYIYGCIEICDDVDGCNGVAQIFTNNLYLLILYLCIQRVVITSLWTLRYGVLLALKWSFLAWK